MEIAWQVACARHNTFLRTQGEVTEWPFTSGAGRCEEWLERKRQPPQGQGRQGVGRSNVRNAHLRLQHGNCVAGGMRQSQYIFTNAGRGDRVAEGVRLEIVCAPKGHRGFDSRPLRHAAEFRKAEHAAWLP